MRSELSTINTLIIPGTAVNWLSHLETLHVSGDELPKDDSTWNLGGLMLYVVIHWKVPYPRFGCVINCLEFGWAYCCSCTGKKNRGRNCCHGWDLNEQSIPTVSILTNACPYSWYHRYLRTCIIRVPIYSHLYLPDIPGTCTLPTVCILIFIYHWTQIYVPSVTGEHTVVIRTTF